ncbi:hypothetical protein MLD38_025708 [Melastoma candidum]|uniref:Uncharacterized protein n=1 Tax=Melastoma candidum TaxID=119954 RepID=A0ACB9NY10_9MYRT|nr:hypothetical protein MLD38_025708 [Melastoma candidum]
MEAVEPLAVESFSYRWLVKFDSPPDAPEGSSFRKSFDDASFIEMDPAMPPSRRFSLTTSSSPDFKFDSTASQPPPVVVPADELFSEGYVLPLFFNHPTRIGNFEFRGSGSTLPQEHDSLQAATVVASGSGDASTSSPGSCQGLPKQIFLKHFNFLKPLYRIFRRQRLSSRTKFTHGTRNWVYPEESSLSSSPRISSAFSADDGRKSSFSECSIYEAVLHCKKSIGRDID